MSAIRIGAGPSLNGVREVDGRVACRGVGGVGRARELLEATRLRCQKGGELHDAIECLDCERFVNYKPSRNRRTVTIRCQWRFDDPVTDLMTTSAALVGVDPGTTIAAADELARRHGIRHLLVAREDDLMGVVCRCDLVPPVLEGETVGDRMSPEVWVLPATANLADAVDVMTSHEIGCVPVVDSGTLRGVLTRGDLRRAGLPEALLGAHRCEACGSHHGVRPHPSLEAIEFCLDCFDQAFTVADYEELGVGD